jgi:alpha-tubulin suppressor-like RCC1 family protein
MPTIPVTAPRGLAHLPTATSFVDPLYVNTRGPGRAGWSGPVRADLQSALRLYPLRSCFRMAGALLLALIGAVPALGQTVEAGSSHTVILKSDGTVWTVGQNYYGQLGDGTTLTRPNPTQVSGLSSITAIAAGNNHTMALTTGGTVYVWGHGGYGQLGDGTTTIYQRTPVAVSLSNVVAISAGCFHSVALRSNGDVYTWGGNGDGQLGNGTTTSSNLPVLVASGAVAIAAGDSHTLVVKSDGTVYGAGRNANGQLGDGTLTSRPSFVQMSGISTATNATAGTAFSVIRLSNETLVSTGNNGAGQLGDGTTSQQTLPVTVSTLTSVTAIAAGYTHVLAIKADGSLWAWGGNGHGPLGDDTQTNRSTPTQAIGIGSVARIGAGNALSFGVTAAGVVYAWGMNLTYILGDGTSVDRIVPTPISGENYDWNVSTPTFGVASGLYTTEKAVMLSATTTGATIHYTQNGSEPTEADPSVAPGGSVSVTTSQTLWAKAFKTGMPASNAVSAQYELKVATPIATPGGGTYGSAQSVTLSTTSPGAQLRYTLDLSTPTSNSTLYSGPIAIGSTTTLKVGGFRAGGPTASCCRPPTQ